MSKKEISEAVALKYPAYADAPFIVAKGKGHLADKMIQIAEENSIPIVHDAVLENVLSVQDIGECIPENTWRAVAAIFAYIYNSEKDDG